MTTKAFLKLVHYHLRHYTPRGYAAISGLHLEASKLLTNINGASHRPRFGSATEPNRGSYARNHDLASFASARASQAHSFCGSTQPNVLQLVNVPI